MLQRMDAEIVDVLLSAEATLPSRFEWTPLSRGYWFLRIPEQEPKHGGDLLQIYYSADEGARLAHASDRGLKELAVAADLSHLVEIADAWIDKHLRFAAILLDRAADWRVHPASEMQKNYIRSLLRRLEPDNPDLYAQIMERLTQIESAEAMREAYEEEDVAIPAHLDRLRLTKGLASQLINFLKQQV